VKGAAFMLSRLAAMFLASSPSSIRSVSLRYAGPVGGGGKKCWKKRCKFRPGKRAQRR
jgi:hypothetical protein